MDKQTITTILNLGLNEIKEGLKTMSKTLSPMDKYYIIEDDLNDLIESPLEYIEDIVGYADELKDEVIKDLTPLQIAISKLYFDKRNARKYLDRSLRTRVLDSKEYKDLASLMTK
jgi:hypothetical protein